MRIVILNKCSVDWMLGAMQLLSLRDTSGMNSE